MAPQPIVFKRNPVTKSRLTNAMLVVAALSLLGLNESNIESLEPALFIATLSISVAILMRLSKRGQRYYLQITSDSLLLHRYLFWGPKTYDISELAEVKRGISPVPGREPVIISTRQGTKIRLSTWWLTQDDLNRVHKVLLRRIK